MCCAAQAPSVSEAGEQRDTHPSRGTLLQESWLPTVCGQAFSCLSICYSHQQIHNETGITLAGILQEEHVGSEESCAPAVQACADMGGWAAAAVAFHLGKGHRAFQVRAEGVRHGQAAGLEAFSVREGRRVYPQKTLPESLPPLPSPLTPAHCAPGQTGSRSLGERAWGLFPAMPLNSGTWAPSHYAANWGCGWEGGRVKACTVSTPSVLKTAP